MTSSRFPARERLALVVLAVVLAAGVGWGLHPQFSWDVDNTAPGSVLRAIAAKFGPRWSSSYGPVPYMLMAVPMVPLLAFFKLTHELGQPSGVYPWGFAHPLWSVNALTLAARLMTVLLAWLVGWMAVRETRESDARAAWLAPVLLLGSAAFVYYGRTSNVDLYYLVWLWAGFHVVERAGRLRALAAGATCAALAVCSKEQSGPIAAVIVLLATWRAFRGVSPAAPRGVGAALVPGLAALLAYVVAWRLPIGLPGWRAHHRFIFEEATYPRTFPATLEGSLQLAQRAVTWLPLALGAAVLAGVVLAAVTRASWRGLPAGARRRARCTWPRSSAASATRIRASCCRCCWCVRAARRARGVRAARAAGVRARGGGDRARGAGVPRRPGAYGTRNDLRHQIEAARWGPTSPAAWWSWAATGIFQARVPAERLHVSSLDSLRVTPRAPFGDCGAPVPVRSQPERFCGRSPGGGAFPCANPACDQAEVYVHGPPFPARQVLELWVRWKPATRRQRGDQPMPSRRVGLGRGRTPREFRRVLGLEGLACRARSADGPRVGGAQATPSVTVSVHAVRPAIQAFEPDRRGLDRARESRRRTTSSSRPCAG